ncbi:MAG: ABC transporter permease [Candidatus Margulisiibacteriota bacterium]
MIWTLFKKEWQLYLNSLWLYALLGVFLVLGSYFFCLLLFYTQTVTVMGFWFNNMSILVLFLAPMIGAKLISEERQLGTLSWLKSLPISPFQLVISKFLAGFAAYGLLLGCSLAYPLTLAFLGTPDWGVIASGYLGLLLFGGALLATSLWLSGWVGSVSMAMVLQFGVSFLLWIVGWMSRLTSGTLQTVLVNLSFLEHLSAFQKGVLMGGDLAFFGLWIATMLYLTWLGRV